MSESSGTSDPRGTGRDGGRPHRGGGGRQSQGARGGYRGGSDRRSDSGTDRREGSRGGSYRASGSSHDDRRSNNRSDGRSYDDNRRSNSSDSRNDSRGGYRGQNERRDDREGGYRGRDNKSSSYRGRDERRDDRGDDRRGGYQGRDDRRRDDRQGGYRGGSERRSSGRGDQEMRPDGRRRDRHNGPQRSGYRENRVNERVNEPAIPADVSPRELDPAIREELRSLSKDNADKVAGHLIMAAALMDSDAEKALAHARAAKERGGRVSITRETLGIAAYHAGQWKEALTELRAARRMVGGPGLVAVMADCERGLGHPEKAIELGMSEEAAQLDPEQRAELAIVISGAHQDLAQPEDALLVLESETAATDLPEVTSLRITYAYADALVAADRIEDARAWFTKADKMDAHGVLDSSDRLKDLGK